MSAPPLLPRPCSAAEAVARAKSMIGNGGQYGLRTGNYHPRFVGGKWIDVPWTVGPDGEYSADCSSFAISWCYKLPNHRPGFNHGRWATVADDINCDSAIQDARHDQECFELSASPARGDLLAYPTIYLAGHPPFIGHVCVVIGTSRVTAWNPSSPRWDQLDVAQCHGPNGFKPGVVATDGSIWLHHDALWPKPEHRSWLLRAKA